MGWKSDWCWEWGWREEWVDVWMRRWIETRLWESAVTDKYKRLPSDKFSPIEPILSFLSCRLLWIRVHVSSFRTPHISVCSCRASLRLAQHIKRLIYAQCVLVMPLPTSNGIRLGWAGMWGTVLAGLPSTADRIQLSLNHLGAGSSGEIDPFSHGPPILIHIGYSNSVRPSVCPSVRLSVTL